MAKKKIPAGAKDVGDPARLHKVDEKTTEPKSVKHVEPEVALAEDRVGTPDLPGAIVPATGTSKLTSANRLRGVSG